MASRAASEQAVSRHHDWPPSRVLISAVGAGGDTGLLCRYDH